MAQDVYEFPDGYVGRKTYVSVEGHSRSIPYVYTYQVRGKNKLLPEYGGGPMEYTPSGPMIMRDISSYRSPIDGSTISSRSQHREHMERHDVIELGNERIKPAPEKNAFKGIQREIKQHINKVREMPQAQYDASIAKTAQVLTTGD